MNKKIILLSLFSLFLTSLESKPQKCRIKDNGHLMDVDGDSKCAAFFAIFAAKEKRNRLIEIKRLSLNDFDANAEAEITDSFGNKINITILFAALEQEGTEYLLEVLNNGANVHWKNANGIDALKYAIILGDISKVKILLDYGANPDAKDNKGRTALDIAKERRQTNIISLLNSKKDKAEPKLEQKEAKCKDTTKTALTEFKEVVQNSKNEKKSPKEEAWLFS